MVWNNFHILHLMKLLCAGDGRQDFDTTQVPCLIHCQHHCGGIWVTFLNLRMHEYLPLILPFGTGNLGEQLSSYGSWAPCVEAE